MKFKIICVIPAVLLMLNLSAAGVGAEVLVTTGKIDGVDAAYGADVSDSDLVNAGAGALSNTTFSSAPYFGPNAHNDGRVGDPDTSDDITFWFDAPVGATYSITYELSTWINTRGYDITSIQTIHGWTNNSGHQKNQNYEVTVSLVGDPGFVPLATVAYLPYGSSSVTASTKVTITENSTGILASGVDAIRFTYTVAGGGSQPSPTIREIDIFGSAIPDGPDLTDPVANTLSPADDGEDVPVDSNLVVVFSEGVTIGSGDITIKDLDTPSETVIPVGDARVSVAGAVLTITPDMDLRMNTNYAVRIAPTAIEDAAGNGFAGITDDTTWNFRTRGVVITAERIDGVDAAYGADASGSDLVNAGAASLLDTTFSSPPYFGPDAHNDGGVGAPDTSEDITFWIGSTTGTTHSITYRLDTSVHTLGYDIASIQTINGWTNNSGHQKNQNYEVFVSMVGDPGFTSLAAVAYLPYTSASITASTKVTISGGGTGILASGVDEVRFVYTVPGAGSEPSPTIREIDVFGAPTAGGDSFAGWIAGFSVGDQTGLGDDPDGDGNDNGVENFLGTAPDTFTQGLVSGTVSGDSFTFTHPRGTLANDLVAAYQWSKNLLEFRADGATDGDGTRVDFVTQPDTPSPGTTTVVATVTGTSTDQLFIRVLVTQP